MASVPSKRINNNNWLKTHCNHGYQVNHDNNNSIIIGGLIVTGLARYNNAWKNLFGNGFVNLGIRGDRVVHVLWRVRDTAFPPRLKNVVILCRTNNTNKDLLHDIVQGLITIGSSFKIRFNNPNIFFCGLLPHDECFSINRVVIDETNDFLSFKCP